MLDIFKLRYFYYTAKHKSVTDAAAVLSVDKSTISRGISALERYMNCKLLFREGKNIELTSKGTILFERSKKLLSEINSINLLIDKEGSKLEGRLKISTTHAMASTLLPAMLADWAVANPEIRIEIDGTSNLPNLNIGEADIAIMPDAPDDNRLYSEIIDHQQLRCFASEGYTQQYGVPKNKSELKNHKFIILRDKKIYNHIYSNWAVLKNCNLTFYETNSLPAMFLMTKESMGIGSFYVKSPLIKNSNLVPILHNDLGFKVECWLIYTKKNKDSEKIKSISDHLKLKFGELNA